MPAHWKHTATRCAVVGCDRTRRKGWSTCATIAHHDAGRSLYGAGRIEPIELSDHAQERDGIQSLRGRV